MSTRVCYLSEAEIWVACMRWATGEARTLTKVSFSSAFFAFRISVLSSVPHRLVIGHSIVDICFVEFFAFKTFQLGDVGVAAFFAALAGIAFLGRHVQLYH